MSLEMADSHISLDDLSWVLFRDIADSNDVPEPASLALVGAALIGAAVARRKKL